MPPDDESKVKLPAFHPIVIKFDYKTLSGDTRLNLTIRPKATMLDETVSFGFETIKLKAGESGTYEGHIDVMSRARITFCCCWARTHRIN